MNFSFGTFLMNLFSFAFAVGLSLSVVMFFLMGAMR